MSTSSTCCIGRGTGETQPPPGPSLNPHIIGLAVRLFLTLLTLSQVCHEASATPQQPPDTDTSNGEDEGSLWSRELNGRSWGPEVKPHLGLFLCYPCRQPAKPPWPLSTSPTPPSPPTASARQLWTQSFHPSHCPGGSRSPTTLHSTLPLGHLCQPLLAAVSSPLRMDSMFRQERGPPTSVPTSWGPEPWRGV